MRMLDNVVDINFYPVGKARNANTRHRPVGMGIMGFQNCLHAMRIPYASMEAVEFADRAMEVVCYNAYYASTVLAEERGVYSVSARFVVPQKPSVARAVLTDYEEIPRFLPDVKISLVRERTASHIVVEQEAVARMLMFSKRVHLMLDITQDADTIRFRDQCAVSFVQYEGSWQLVPKNGGTEIVYALTAQPSFDVPDIILKRMLKRDAGRMIERLAREMAARSR